MGEDGVKLKNIVKLLIINSFSAKGEIENNFLFRFAHIILFEKSIIFKMTKQNA